MFTDLCRHRRLYLVPKSDSLWPPIDPQNFDSLWNEWVQNLTLAIQHFSLNVSLVVDGPRIRVYILTDPDTPFPEDMAAFYGWPTTYAATGEDIKDKSSCLYSNSGDCERKLVLNNEANPIPFTDPAEWVTQLCPVEFGKFWNSSFPWVCEQIVNGIT